MRSLVVASLLAAAFVVAPAARAQRDSMVVRTIPLHRMNNADAVTLLLPYVTGHGGVSATGSSVRAVTIRATPAAIAEAEKVLAQYDKSPSNVNFTFQLVVADFSNTRDPGLAGLDSILRTSLKFTGYHVLSTNVSTATETNGPGWSRVTMSGEGQDYMVTYSVDDIADQPSSVRVRVSLEQPMVTQPLISTGLVIPNDHTVIIGGAPISRVATKLSPIPADRSTQAVPAMGTGGGRRPYDARQDLTTAPRTLFLVVRAQIMPPAKSDD